MVATSKMKRARDLARVLDGLDATLELATLSHASPDETQNLRGASPSSQTRGLAGGFNANLIKEARARLAELERRGAQVDVHVIGKKGIGYFKYVGRATASERVDITDRPTAENAAQIVEQLMAEYIAGTLDGVYVTYSKFNSVLSTPPTTEQVLPVTPPVVKDGGVQRDYLLFPSAEAILTELLPSYVRNSVYRALVETVAGEQSARRTAMKNATDNAGDILNVLRRTYNRARQAQITQEIAEIVGGASALQG